MSGRAVLLDRAQCLHNKAASMEALCNMLPAMLTPEQDEHLWKIACEL